MEFEDPTYEPANDTERKLINGFEHFQANKYYAVSVDTKTRKAHMPDIFGIDAKKYLNTVFSKEKTGPLLVELLRLERDLNNNLCHLHFKVAANVTLPFLQEPRDPGPQGWKLRPH